MSRIRVVKGKYTKLVDGDYNISSEGNIRYNAISEVRNNGLENGVSYGKYGKIESNITEDFEIRFSLSKEKRHTTFVPFGILDFKGNYENAFFAFDFSLMLSDVDQLSFNIKKEDGSVLYAITYLPEVVISRRKIPQLLDDINKNKPEFSLTNPKLVWDWQKIFNFHKIDDYTKVGSYVIFWDGFDNNGIYDSANFNNKKLKAVLIASKNGIEKTVEVEFSTQYKEVNWVDVKIDKNNKKIDTTLRVNLKDGGAKGLNSSNAVPVSEQTNGVPISTRTRSFDDLEKLALDGINYHWGRNQNHAVAKGVNINSESWEVYVNSVNSEDNAMDDVSLIYNTNRKWMRSGNPGSATGNPISWIGNLVSREAICYNVGYIKYSDGWGYNHGYNEDLEFKFTSAHEIGHEILKSYGGTAYSYGHKGSVNVVTQSRKDEASAYPTSGEIDIMPYYPVDPPISLYDNYVAAEKDVLSLIWITKIQIE